MSRGRLIAFEGGEGSGKSTQSARFAEALGALLTREPGGTPLGERVRELVLGHGHHIGARAEALLMAAARAQHVEEVIEPALIAGRDVVTDRFTPSSIAYQAFGRGLGRDDVAALSSFATRHVVPDLVFLIDVPFEVGLGRRSGHRDRIESEERDFHERVATGFRDQAVDDPHRWLVIDGRGTIDEVAERVWVAWEHWQQHGAAT